MNKPAELIKIFSKSKLTNKYLLFALPGSVTVDDAVESTPESTHNIFSSLQSGPFSPASTGDPYFDSTVPRNVTALVGKTAYLGCRVKNLGNRTVILSLFFPLYLICAGSYNVKNYCQYHEFSYM